MDRINLAPNDRETLDRDTTGMFITQIIDKLNEIVDWINSQ